MPVMACQSEGKDGYKWGDNGVCFTGVGAREKAEAVGQAIEAAREDRADPGALTEYRQDIGGDISSYVDDNGYLRVEGIAAKTGILTYLLPDGTVRRELVTAETLFDTESLDSLTGSPVTIEHPGIVTTETSSKHSRGSVPKAVADGDRLKVGIVVTSQDAIDAVKGGKRQLSPGYRAELDYTPGTHEGEEYDAVQKRRVYNHLAIVSGARGGPECRLNLDGFNCAVEVTNETTNEVQNMATLRLSSGATVEVADASTAATIQNDLNQLATRADAADNMVSKEEFDALQGKYDQLKADYDAMKEDMDKDKDRMDADEIGATLETIENARKIKPDVEVKQDGKYLDRVSIMAAALGVSAEGKSADYLQGRFDTAVENAGEESIRKQRMDANGNPAQPVESGRARFIREQQNRGRQQHNSEA